MTRKKDDSRVMYLLTIEGEPAIFDGQICYLNDNGRGRVRATQRICATKEEADAAIAATEKYRLRKGFDFDPEMYSYVRIRVPSTVPSETPK
jgi:hypothetical protein